MEHPWRKVSGRILGTFSDWDALGREGSLIAVFMVGDQ